MSKDKRKSPLAVAAGHLVGMRIVRVSYLSEEDAAAMGWSQRPIVIELSSGGYVYASCDDEGNDGGSLFGGGGPLGFWTGSPVSSEWWGEDNE